MLLDWKIKPWILTEASGECGSLKFKYWDWRSQKRIDLTSSAIYNEVFPDNMIYDLIELNETLCINGLASVYVASVLS